MTRDHEKELHQAERAKERAKRADSFWNAFQMTENGRIKSTLLLNSFCLAILFVAVYAVTFLLLTDPIHSLFSGAPLAVENVVNALVPAVVGTAVCSLFHFLCQPQTLVAAYLWLAALSVACLVTMVILLRGESGAIQLFLQFFAMLIPAPLVCGLASTCWVLRRKQRSGTSAETI